jgi:lipoprotein-releasing system permease protein
VGIAVTTAALVILLSAFNGIESMVEKLYSEFDSDIVIRSSIGKTFNENQIDFKKINQFEGVKRTSKAIEEIVVLKKEKKWVNAKMLGVESTFLDMSGMVDHMVDGYPTLNENNKDVSLIGASLLDDLGGYIPSSGYESILLYAPKRDAKVSLGSNPFITSNVLLSGRINFNREVNAEFIVVPFNFARNLLSYESDITSVCVEVEEGFDNLEVKERLQEMLGKGFVVKTNYEKNELIFKTSKSEKLIVMVILLLIFIVAAVNLVASLTMLFIEKMDNIKTMLSFGADRSFIFRIFFFEGLIIAFKGIIIGLLLGYAICLVQVYGHVIEMPNANGEPFPVKIKYSDGLLIISLVSILSFLASYVPVKYLLKRNFGSKTL